jgi:hypothetical protein
MSSEQISGLHLHDVLDALGRSLEHGVGAGLRRVLLVMEEARARAGGQVDEHVGVLLADALDRLPVERLVHAGLGGLGIAHVDVHDRGARLGRIEAGVGDLLGRHRNGRLRPGVSADPVTAQEIITLRAISRSLDRVSRRQPCGPEIVAVPPMRPDYKHGLPVVCVR